MRVFFHNYNIWSISALYKCGYAYRKEEGDFILDDGVGRFHAKILDSKAVDIHYDLYVEWRHVSGFRMPEKHNEERRRIFRKLRFFRRGDLSPEKFKRLQEKYTNKLSTN